MRERPRASLQTTIFENLSQFLRYPFRVWRISGILEGEGVVAVTGDSVLRTPLFTDSPAEEIREGSVRLGAS
jgi:hypothetical protein